MSSGTARKNRLQSNRSMDSMWVPFILWALCFVQVGCTPFENRWRRNAAIDPSQDDDWAPPKVNSPSSAYRTSKPNRPSASQATAKTSKDYTASGVTSIKDPQRANYKSPTKGALPTKSNAVELAKNTSAQRRIHDSESPKPAIDSKTISNIIETDPQDLDLVGAIATLPPNLQMVLKRQLEALEKRDQETYALTSQKALSQPVEKKVSMRITDDDNKTVDTQQLNVATTNKNTKPQLQDASPAEALSSAAIISQITQPDLTSPRPQSLATASVNQASVQKSSVQQASVQQASVQQASGQQSSVQQSSAAVPTNNVNSDGVVTASATSSVLEKKTGVGMVSPSSVSAQWNHDLAESITKLEKQLKDSPSSDESVRISQEMTLRMLYVANRQLEEAMRPIEGLTESERDYIRHQAQALYEASNPDAMPVKSRKWSLVMNSQRAATDQLAAVSNLDVKTLAFCTDVQGYGVITKFSNNTFQPDQDLLLYCELENVAADEVKDGFETQLQGSYEIIDPNGRKIADQLLPMEKEICKNHRRDYFIVYRIYTPMQIGPGNYQLRLTVEDMKAKKFGQASLDFQIQK